MRVNHFFRSVASKLFWKTQPVWYKIPEEWNETIDDDMFQRFRLDPEFAKHITQVSISLPAMYAAVGSVVEDIDLMDMQATALWTIFLAGSR
jgi:hypothetical protein